MTERDGICDAGQPRHQIVTASARLEGTVVAHPRPVLGIMVMEWFEWLGLGGVLFNSHHKLSVSF